MFSNVHYKTSMLKTNLLPSSEIKPPPPIKQENSHGVVKTEVKQEVPETPSGGARLKEEDYDSSTTVSRLS